MTPRKFFTTLLLVCALATPRPLLGSDASTMPVTEMEHSFSSPPASARPWIFWQWNNSSISKDGIKADLQAIHDAGFTGVQFFDCGMGAPDGTVHYFSPEWMSCLHLTFSETKRLGLDFGMHNCPGWSSSGGPWIKPKDSMKMLVDSETSVTGPSQFSAALPQPTTHEGLYEDVALFAVHSDNALLVPVKASCDLDSFDAARLQAGAPGYSLKIPQGTDHAVLFDFGKPVTARTLFLRFAPRLPLYFTGEVLASDDGVSFRSVRKFGAASMISSYSLDDAPPVTARYFKVILSPQLTAAFPDYTETDVDEMWLSAQPMIERAGEKSGNGGEYNFPRSPTANPESVPPPQIVNLTAQFKDGKLDWEVPPGDWKLLRIGYTSTGSRNGPEGDFASGLECDKLNAAALDLNWKASSVPLLKAGPMKDLEIDSYEKGGQNWTPGIIDQFKGARGYDPVPYLPAIFGIVVGSKDQSERFLYDWRTNVSDLMAKNYFGHFAELCKQAGVDSLVEPYGGPFDSLVVARDVSVPMDEMPGHLATSLGHVYGHNVISYETFTSADADADGGWRDSPASLKELGDSIFCKGVNRLTLHSYVHQSLMDPRAKPGLTLGQYGMHFGRNQTWWPFAKPWVDYMARCQFLLRQGRFQADVFVFPGENAPNTYTFSCKDAGYDYDVCDRNALLSILAVKDGHLSVPSGMTYRLLSVDDSRVMSLPVLQAIERLINDGAVVCASRPLQTPGLTHYPESEKELAAIADRLWGAQPGPSGDVKIGKGRLFWGVSAPQVLAQLGEQPDFSIEGGAKSKIDWIHRSTAASEIYFVSNQTGAPANFNALFRSQGKPELLHPESGKIEEEISGTSVGGLTRLSLQLPKSGSVFVVFRKSGDDRPLRVAGQTHAAGEDVQLPAPLVLDGAWNLSFPPGLGAPATAVFDQLKALPASDQEGIRHFSGIVTYQKDFEVPAAFFTANKHVELSLGDVGMGGVARVELNGTDLGIAWAPPFTIDASKGLKPGTNKLVIRLATPWANRLIGDESLPDDCDYGGPGNAALMHLPQWVKDGSPRPSQRIAFVSYKTFQKDSKLVPSGLVGPVSLQAAPDGGD